MLPLRFTFSAIALMASLIAAPTVGMQLQPLSERLLRQGLARVAIHADAITHLTSQVMHPFDRMPRLPKAIEIQAQVGLPPALLHDAAHHQISMSALRDTPTLLAFGAVHCAAGCPDVLAQFSSIKHHLGPFAGDVRFVMIGMDCHHDTPEALQALANRYDPEFVALTGDVGTVLSLASRYGWSAIPRVANQRLTPYGIFTVYLDANGNWTKAFPLTMPAQFVADVIVLDLTA